MKTELRLGNHVYISPKDSPDWLIPSILNTGNFIAILRGLTVATPVPLTPEILAKAGFEDISTYQGYAKMFKQVGDGTMIFAWYTRKEGIEWASIDDISIKQSVKYVHQLQNLYFTLTGEELTIQL